MTCNAGHRSRERMCQDDATGVEAYQCPGKKHNTEVCDQPVCSTGRKLLPQCHVADHFSENKVLADFLRVFCCSMTKKVVNTI